MLAGDGIAMSHHLNFPMKSQLLKAMHDAYWNEHQRQWRDGPKTDEWEYSYEETMRCALLCLAENVTDEMVDAADYELASDDSFVTKEVIAAALRKAAGK